MTTAQRSQFERLLQEERTRIAALLARLTPPGGDLEEPGRFGDDLESRASMGASRGDDSAMSAHAQRELDELDSALRILYEEPERFGVCDVCGRPISLGRLAVVPTTRFCSRHANR
jgi:RNA polymerase-binding transcription factor DksA